MSEELVKRLRAQAVYMPEKFSKNAELLDVLMKAADAIEELQQIAWIPVTERLPDKPGIYAVWTAKGFGNHLSTSYFDGDSWSLRITHWMPLPQPPKEE